MENYQLYNTNVLMGGQQKLDLVLESDGELYVKDFHITPISDNVPYNNILDENLLNYSHRENLKNFYKKIEGYFYNPMLDSAFQHMYPIKDDEKNYSDMYNSGPKRSDYSKYNKQIEYLCPLWLESVKDNSIEFKIQIKSENSENNKVLGTKYLKLTNLNDQKSKFHDKFVRYLYDYIKYVGVSNEDNIENCISINFTTRKSYIHGFEITSGNIIDKSYDSLINNLLSRERPFMENDYMICNSFKNNNMILKNLFNINLCFNIEDIISHNLEKQLVGQSVIIDVVTLCDDVELERKTFYTNYENINRYNLSEDDSEVSEENIFDYLQDNKYIDFVDKNKFDPQICHWSINDNNDYIFNLYKGFGSFYKQGNTVEYVNNRFFNTPDLYHTDYQVYLNNLNWCNRRKDPIKLSDINNFMLGSNKWDFEKESTNFKPKWIYNVQYNKVLENDLYVLLRKADADELETLIQYNNQWIQLDDDLYMWVYRNKILIISNNNDKLTFKSIYNIVNSTENKDNTFNEFRKKILSVKYPKILVLNNSLSIKLIQHENLSVNEIEYFKEDDVKVSIERYDGKLKPSFININDDFYKNIYYYKKSFDDEIKKQLYKYDGITPLYKSIYYYYISEIDNDDKLKKLPEYKWKDKNSILVLKSNINDIIDVSVGQNIDDEIKGIIISNNNIDNNIDNNIENENENYIISLYQYKYDEIETNKYSIQIELK